MITLSPQRCSQISVTAKILLTTEGVLENQSFVTDRSRIDRKSRGSHHQFAMGETGDCYG